MPCSMRDVGRSGGNKEKQIIEMRHKKKLNVRPRAVIGYQNSGQKESKKG